MKKIFILSLLCFFTISGIYALNNNHYQEQPFIFIEKGVEYAVFKNGEFDFNVIKKQSSSVRFRNQNLNISFNSGCNYTPYIERNRYGDIIAIDHTNIYYDRLGRVNQIGNVNIAYNNFGNICSIGGLHINYQNYQNQYSCSGYINQINHYYTPRYRNYKKPTNHHHLYQSNRIISNSQTYYGPKTGYRNYDRYCNYTQRRNFKNRKQERYYRKR